MAFKIIKCPWCGKEARITYEENRVYQMKCYSCRNTMLHVDHSFDSAVDFFEHHANLLQAENDGRLVVLPVRTKETVYVVGEKRIMECFIAEAYIDDARGLEYMVSFDCDDNCDGCPFNSWRQDYSGEYSCDGEYGEGCILGSGFEKTFFLTRAAAEAALAQKGGESDA